MAFNLTPGTGEFVSRGAAGVAGQFDTKRKFSLSDFIILQERSYAKLDNIFMAEQKMIEVDDPEPKILTMQEHPVVFAITGNEDGTFENDAIEMTDALATFLQAGDVLMIPTVFCLADGSAYSSVKFGTDLHFPETIIVTDVTLSGISAGTAKVTVRRGNGENTSAPAAGVVTQLTSAAQLIHQGNAIADGGRAVDAIHFEPDESQNFCQFRSKTWEETRSEGGINVYGKTTMQQKANMKTKELFREGEIAGFYGIKNKSTQANNRLQWREGGIVEIIPRASTSLDGADRFQDHDGAFDLEKQREFDEITYRYGNADQIKHWFCGGEYFTSLFNALEDKITVNDEFTGKYGWEVKELNLGQGRALLHRHPLFTDLSSAAQNYSKDCVIVDMEYVWQLNYIPVSVRENVQDNDAHLTKNEIFRQKSMHRTFPSAHSYRFGLT
ncbi:MAG: hypothetical protein KAS32_26325 [Candidatus Peribacteraceae bacterium]|nr:hypothetical protein [Candidatus Peribacteraceae bacterium]